MKCVAGHQPNLYPYAGFFAKAAYVSEFVIVDNTQYVKKEYHNRNRIKLINGQESWLTVPVKNAGRFTQKINEVEIDNTGDWRKHHLRSLLVNYRKAPFFKQHFPVIEGILSAEWTMLVDLNVTIINELFKVFSIGTETVRASEKGIEGKASELILDICRKTGADAYLHGKHSRDYVDFGMLERNGVKNLIQDYQSPAYDQINGPFIPNLSVLDILFNCGAQKAGELILSGNIVSVP